MESIRQKLDSKILATIRLLCAGLILLRFFSSFSPHLRLWGLNHLAYFNFPFRIFITVAGLLLCIPIMSRLALNGIEKVARLKISLSQNKLYLAISALSIIPFWIFRSRTPLLGDGTLWITELTRGINSMKIRKEPLTLIIHFYTHNFLDRLLNWDVQMTYALVSFLSGALFIFILLKFMDHLEFRKVNKGLFFTVLLFMGGSQFFFGYLENYTLHYVSLLAFLFMGVRYLSGYGSLLLPSVFIILSIGFHNQALSLIPSYLFLILFSLGKNKIKGLEGIKFKHVLSGVIVSLLILGGIYFLKGYYTRGEIVMPLNQTPGSDDTYTLFSLEHILDIANQHLLISSSGVLLLLVLVLFTWKKIEWSMPGFSFLFLASFYFLLFNFFVNPRLGMARDWDLFAASGLALSIFVLVMLTQFVENQEFLKRIGLILAGTAVVSGIPWFSINSNEDKSVERFENLLVLDRARSGYGYENLSIYFRNKGMLDETIDAVKNAIDVEPENPRYYVMLGNAYMEKRLPNQAIAEYQKALQINPDRVKAQINIGIALAIQGRFEEAIPVYENVLERFPQIPEAHNNLADAYYQTGRYDFAWRHLRRAETLGFPVNPEFFKALRRVSEEPK
jgi:tetratricopeptide (TPR) repeat protein